MLATRLIELTTAPTCHCRPVPFFPSTHGYSKKGSSYSIRVTWQVGPSKPLKSSTRGQAGRWTTPVAPSPKTFADCLDSLLGYWQRLLPMTLQAHPDFATIDETPILYSMRIFTEMKSVIFQRNGVMHVLDTSLTKNLLIDSNGDKTKGHAHHPKVSH